MTISSKGHKNWGMWFVNVRDRKTWYNKSQEKRIMSKEGYIISKLSNGLMETERDIKVSN